MKWSDYYTYKAKFEKFPARSIYKLQEIQKKYRIIKKNESILDLGCAPGSWSIYASNIVGENGSVIGVDLNPVKIKLSKNIVIFTKDILSLNNIDFFEYFKKNFDLILSDMSPMITGNKVIDNTRSLSLCMKALEIVDFTLSIGGSFVCKIFQSDDSILFFKIVRQKFMKSFFFKPKSSRKSSREIYIIGKNKI